MSNRKEEYLKSHLHKLKRVIKIIGVFLLVLIIIILIPLILMLTGINLGNKFMLAVFANAISVPLYIVLIIFAGLYVRYYYLKRKYEKAKFSIEDEKRRSEREEQAKQQELETQKIKLEEQKLKMAEQAKQQELETQKIKLEEQKLKMAEQAKQQQSQQVIIQQPSAPNLNNKKSCIHCGNFINTSAQFCEKCGKEQ